MQVLPRALLTKLGKSKPNMLYTALTPRVASRGILAASIVGETPKKENSLLFTLLPTSVSIIMPASHTD
jgi:hypothetical protein